MNIRLAFALILLWLGLLPKTSSAACPACLGSIGLPLRGQASTTLRDWDFYVRYRFESQSKDIYYRNLQIGQTSLYRNLDRWSIGFILPLSGTDGFMADGKHHSVRSVYGTDISARYFILKAPLGPTRPILSLIGSVKVPLGYVYHEEHESPSVPWVLTSGLGSSINLKENILFGEAYFSHVLKRHKNYNFGDRGSLFTGVMRFFGNRPFIGLGLNLTSLWQQGDNEPFHVDVLENTRRLTVDIGPRVSLLLEQLFLDVSAGYFVLHALDTPKALPSRWSAEVNFSYGF